jgi:hypothetical protein
LDCDAAGIGPYAGWAELGLLGVDVVLELAAYATAAPARAPTTTRTAITPERRLNIGCPPLVVDHPK